MMIHRQPLGIIASSAIGDSCRVGGDRDLPWITSPRSLSSFWRLGLRITGDRTSHILKHIWERTSVRNTQTRGEERRGEQEEGEGRWRASVVTNATSGGRDCRESQLHASGLDGAKRADLACVLFWTTFERFALQRMEVKMTLSDRFPAGGVSSSNLY